MKRLSLLAILLSFGCSSSGSSEELSYVEGRAVKGNLADASVDVWSVGNNGAPQRLLGSTTTGSDGTFSLSFSGYQGWTCVMVWGGSYTDEATGATSTIPQATPLMGVAYASPTPASYVVSPVTTVQTLVAKDDARDPAVSFDLAVANSAIKMEAAFGIPNPHLTAPVDLTAGPASAGDGARYGAVLAAFSVCALDMGVTGGEFSYGVAKDARDGKFDGLEFFDPVQLSLSTTLTPNTLSLLAFFGEDWLDNSPQNASGLTSSDIPLTALASANDMLRSGPRVQGVWNGHSPLTGGTQVTALGWGFGSSPEIFVGATQVTPTFASDTEVQFTTPALSAALSYDFTIRGDLGLTYTWAGAVRYYNESAAPSVTGMVPAEGPVAGGTPVRIKGANLDPDTKVFFGGMEALVTTGTYPREIVAIAPKASDAGAVTVQVENGASLTANVPGSFTYKKKDVGRAFDDSDLLGSYTAIHTKYDYSGTDFRVNVGTSVWQLDGAGQGTFTRTDKTTVGGVLTTSTASGSAYATAEGQNGQVLTVDGGSNATNLYAYNIHPGGNAASGLTAFGTIDVFKHGSGLDNSSLQGTYGTTGTYVGFTPDLTFGAGTGTIEFDGNGGGGINMKIFERQGEGTGYRTWLLVVPLTYSVSPSGGLDVELDPDSANPWSLSGRVTPDGGLAGFYYSGTSAWQGRMASFRAIRLDGTVAPEDFRGEFIGGSLGEKTFDDEGTFYPKVTATFSGRLLETAGTESRYFGTQDGSAQTPGPLDRILQTGRVSLRYAGAFGQLQYGDGASFGYFAPGSGYFIHAGRVAETVDTTDFSDRISFGVQLRFDAHYSKYSSSGIQNTINWTSQWKNPTTPITGDELNETSIGSFTFNPSKAMTIGGKAFNGLGGFDAIALNSKFVDRTDLTATTSFGPATDLQTTFGYTYLGNRYLQVIAERDEAGPLGVYNPGFVWGKGATSPTGAFGGYASTAAVDRTSFTAFAPQTMFTLGVSYRFGSSLYDFDGSSGATLGRAERGTVSVNGTSVTLGFQQSLFTEGTSGATTSAGTRPGSVTPNPNGTLDFLYGASVYGGFNVGDGDLLVTTDFSSSTQTGIHVLIKDAAAMPTLYDYGVTDFSKFFGDTNLPGLTGLRLRQGTFTPRENLISFLALDQFRHNDSPTTTLGRQFNTGTYSATATGAFNFNFGNVDYSGAVTGDGCFGFGLEGPDDEAPTTMGILLHLNF